jgi:hypothetical protein
MVLKLKHELGIGNLTLLERRRGCVGIPKLLIFLFFALFFFLIMSSFTPNKKNIFISMII